MERLKSEICFTFGEMFFCVRERIGIYRRGFHLGFGFMGPTKILDDVFYTCCKRSTFVFLLYLGCKIKSNILAFLGIMNNDGRLNGIIKELARIRR